MDKYWGVRRLVVGLCLAGVFSCSESTAPSSPDITVTPDAADTAEPLADVITPEDTDTAQIQDTTPMEDTAPPPEDTAPVQDTAPPIDTWQPPLFPESASPVTLVEPIPAQSVQLRATGGTTVAAMQGDRVLAQDADGTQLLDTLWDDVQGEFSDGVGRVLDTAEWGADTLLACEDTLHVLSNGFVFESPLQALVPDEAVHRLETVTSVGSDAVWMGTDMGLYSWENDAFFSIVPEGLPTANAVFAAGGTYDGLPAVWVAADGWVYAILEENGALVSLPVLDALTVSEMRVDDAQRLWLLSDGDIVLRHPDGTWEWLSFAQPVQSMVGGAHSAYTWFFLTDSVVLHHDTYFRWVEGMTVPLDSDMTATGDIVAAHDDAIVQWTLDTEVAPIKISWTGHIKPLFDSKCKSCHTPGNVGTDLSTMQLWMANKGDIMSRVQEDMPADDPPLDSNLVAMIQEWIDGGFVE